MTETRKPYVFLPIATFIFEVLNENCNTPEEEDITLSILYKLRETKRNITGSYSGSHSNLKKKNG